MKIAVLRERSEGETRVAATPETVSKFLALGASVGVERGAGLASRIPDADYEAAGATLAENAAGAVKDADIILVVRRPNAASLKGATKDALLIGALDPYGHEPEIAALGQAGVVAIAMEFMPRITRAQVMDILSSQANLAGYQAVIEAAGVFDRAFPMMMTAAGTVRPAKAFVMGAGVAGLQAIATAKRLGAAVSATDVRPAAKEQVQSLGAKFVAVEDEEFKQAETAAGYAKPMSAEYQAKQAALTAQHIAKQDVVVTTALIPGRPAPRLISAEMVESMAPGSVIVDLAAERGGNVELTQPGKVIEHKGVTIIGYTNLAGRIPTTASQLYARNLYAFIETFFDRKTKAYAVNWDDELVKATMLTRGGDVVHPNLVIAANARLMATAPEGKPAEPTAAAAAATQEAAEPQDAPRKAAARKPRTSAAKAEPSAAAAPARKTAARKPVKAAATGEDTSTDAKPAATTRKRSPAKPKGTEQ